MNERNCRTPLFPSWGQRMLRRLLAERPSLEGVASVLKCVAVPALLSPSICESKFYFSSSVMFSESGQQVVGEVEKWLHPSNVSLVLPAGGPSILCFVGLLLCGLACSGGATFHDVRYVY